MGNLVVGGGQLGLGGARGPAGAHDGEPDGVAPVGVGGRVGSALGLAGVHVVLDERGALLDNGAHLVE